MKKLLITVNGKRYEVDVEVVSDEDLSEPQPLYPPQTYSINTPVAQPRVAAPAPSAPSKAAQGPVDAKSLQSPMNGVMLEIPISEGQEVKMKDVLFIMEAMKMKTNVSCPFNAKVKKIHVKVGDTIESGQVLVTFE